MVNSMQGIDIQTLLTEGPVLIDGLVAVQISQHFFGGAT